MEIPIYLFTGFLEAGKTKFISETMQDPAFNDGTKRILIITCEDGEEEYDPAAYGDNVTFASFEDEQSLTVDRFSAMVKRAKADMVVVEYNGMWKLDSFFAALSEEYAVYQELLTVDATTAAVYNANMRQLMVDKLMECDVVVFNRVGDNTNREELHKLVRGVSRGAKIYFETVDGEVEFDDIEDPLPFDINAPVIEIKDEDFAIFYRDMNEEFDKYDGKTVRFKGIVALDSSIPKGHFAIGRHIMTCCVDDIEYRGMVAKGMGKLKLNTRDWVTVEGTLGVEYSKLYRNRGPVLTVKSIEKAEKPIQEVATFY